MNADIEDFHDKWDNKDVTMDVVKEEIWRYEAKPALSFAVTRTLNQMDLAKQSNLKIHEIHNKTKQLQSLKDTLFGLDKLIKQSDLIWNRFHVLGY
jgi:hypothetical protein